MPWCGVVWLGVLWCGVVWCGVIVNMWCGCVVVVAKTICSGIHNTTISRDKTTTPRDTEVGLASVGDWVYKMAGGLVSDKGG